MCTSMGSNLKNLSNSLVVICQVIVIIIVSGEKQFAAMSAS
jgi:hypothetical protein